MKANRRDKNARRVLGRVTAEEFVGRKAELAKLVAHAKGSSEKRALLLLLAPSAGVSELLRQAYDELFNSRENIVPVYFAFSRNDSTAVSKAIEFLNTFLRQFIAYRRNEPAICNASLPLDDLAQLAPASDFEWITRLVEAYNRLRFANDDRELIRFCLSAPQRVPVLSGRPFVMIEGMQLAETAGPNENLTSEILRLFTHSTLLFAFAGLRRHLLNAFHEAEINSESVEILRLEKLADEDARRLVIHSALRQQVSINNETADLLVQQFDSSPFFITSLLQAARDKNVSLESYRHCEKLYVDELMGGRIQHYFASLLEGIASQPKTRQALIRLLCEELVSDVPKATLESFRRRLDVSVEEIERILRGLHIQEFVNWDDSSVEVAKGPSVWRDYLKVRYRLDVLAEPRALVVADTISDALKRAPLTMDRHYRRAATLGLRDLLDKFDCQRVPASLFHFGKFSRSYKGVSDAEMISGLEAETESIKLPRVVHVASCTAFAPEMRQVCDEDRCMVARAFEGATFSDANEVVWLAAEIDSKLEVDPELTEVWCARLERLGRQLGFQRIRIWLIANQGFSEEAMQILEARGAYSSSRRQVEILTARINETSSMTRQQASVNEYVMILPMDEDNELVAANAVEQIARRLNFRPEAINQIKTAIVEACINAAEHSFSPDRKIYQRFRVESDRLVITISSRGVVPVKMMAQDGAKDAPFGKGSDSAEKRRGWGFDLIRTLMDEVEFECVDDGTSLRMTKYLRK
jgi:serine/threonine-protein kinase RsbW